MNLDDLLRMAAEASPSRLELAQVRRTARQIRDRYAQANAEGRDLVEDFDLRDPLTVDCDEAARIARAARMAKLGSFTWVRGSEQMTWSEEMSLMLGYPPGTVRPSTELFLSRVHRDDSARFCQAITRAWHNRTAEQTTYRIVRKDGVVRYMQCCLEVLVNEDGTPSGIIGTGQDVTTGEQSRLEIERLTRRCETMLTALADRDPVTGLFTRARFADEIDRALRAGSGALLVLSVGAGDQDLRRRGTLPDDQLMESVAALVTSLARRTDVCGHVGPGEIGILMHNTPTRMARVIAVTIMETLRDQQFLNRRSLVRVNACGGLVHYTATTDLDGLDLLIDAATAWRRAKRRAVPLAVFSQPASAGQRQHICRNRVRAALAHNRFTLYAQPILDLGLNQVTRHELLLRLLDEAGNLVPAADFLDTAERSNEVLAIDLWVLERTMELLADGPETAHYHVNVSGRSLGDPRLLPQVEHLIERFNVNPTQLTFEITETAVIGNMTEARRFAHHVRDLGGQLALDDFGAGYGSFRYLKYFPIDLVKIDGEFISSIVDSRADQVMVRALVEVCQALGIRTVAEFAEDWRTVELLREYGIEFVQGYTIGRPQPIARPRGAAALALPAPGDERRPGQQPRIALG